MVDSNVKIQLNLAVKQLPHSKKNSKNHYLCYNEKLNDYRLSRSQLFSSNPKDHIQENNSSNKEGNLDELLSKGNLQKSIQYLRSNPESKIDKSRFISIFKSIEQRTKDADENVLSSSSNTRIEDDKNLMMEVVYPPISAARTEMNDMYKTLRSLNHLPLFGAAGNENYPAAGSKSVSQPLLESITELNMSSLTPKPTNTLLIAGVFFAVLEGILSLVTGIDYNVFIFGTILLALFDNVVVNGALFETAQRIIMPEYSKKVLRHEAGHFLVAYLLGCPVEGCVLSTWDALQDVRFDGSRTGVSAGTSFFDEDLSNQVNGRAPLARSSIDRYSAIVMAGIAAEAIHFGGADGGASDEIALVRFLTQISPRGGGALSWNAESIRNQARWGAMQSVLLLRHYKSSYEALVKALERGGNLGECVWAIEKAAMDDGTDILRDPLGIIVDKGLFGEWKTDAEKISEFSTAKNSNLTPNNINGQSRSNKPTETKQEKPLSIEESENLLKDYRTAMEKKLKDIETELESLNNNN